jgi:hypothetical protein
MMLIVEDVGFLFCFGINIIFISILSAWGDIQYHY